MGHVLSSIPMPLMNVDPLQRAWHLASLPMITGLVFVLCDLFRRKILRWRLIWIQKIV